MQSVCTFETWALRRTFVATSSCSAMVVERVQRQRREGGGRRSSQEKNWLRSGEAWLTSQ